LPYIDVNMRKGKTLVLQPGESFWNKAWMVANPVSPNPSFGVFQIRVCKIALLVKIGVTVRRRHAGKGVKQTKRLRWRFIKDISQEFRCAAPIYPSFNEISGDIAALCSQRLERPKCLGPYKRPPSDLQMPHLKSRLRDVWPIERDIRIPM
jgi:hypothetical protein